MIEIKYDEDGNIIHNGERYKAIKELDRKLTELNISHEMHRHIDGYQICVPKDHKINSFDGDAIQNFGSYGAEQDLIEVYGFFLNEPKGFLTVEEALKYFVEWEKYKSKSNT